MFVVDLIRLFFFVVIMFATSEGYHPFSLKLLVTWPRTDTVYIHEMWMA